MTRASLGLVSGMGPVPSVPGWVISFGIGTYRFLYGAELLELLSEGGLLRVPCEPTSTIHTGQQPGPGLEEQSLSPNEKFRHDSGAVSS